MFRACLIAHTTNSPHINLPSVLAQTSSSSAAPVEQIQGLSNTFNLTTKSLRLFHTDIVCSLVDPESLKPVVVWVKSNRSVYTPVSGLCAAFVAALKIKKI